MKTILWLLLCLHFSLFSNTKASQEKILICGVCKNVALAVPNTIENIENLGALFADYAVIIYENNSSDQTSSLFQQWAQKNPHVLFITETLPVNRLPHSREETIARARNIVLSKARDPKYADFKYLTMVDLDFLDSWPIHSIIQTIEGNEDWDCVSANGMNEKDHYYDMYAFRDERFPFGPELLQDGWAEDVENNPVSFQKNEPLKKVFSAFGGLAIYKTQSILPFSYSGTVTEDLRNYYKEILIHHPRASLHGHWLRSLLKGYRNPQISCYLRRVKMKKPSHIENVPILFEARDACVCEHVTLHAAMAQHGFGKFYVNPDMVIKN